MIVQKLILGAMALIGLAVSGTGIYKMIVGDNGGGTVVGGLFIMFLIALLLDPDQEQKQN